MKVNKKNYSTIWLENEKIKIIDQTCLPFKFKTEELKSLNDFCIAIKNMKVRGAPLIGITAALGFAKSIIKNPNNSNIEISYSKLLKTRPTAVNLKWALERIKKEILKLPNDLRGKQAMQLATSMRLEDIKNCKKIGENGFKIIKKIFKKKKKTINILTHCNAGWLATVDYGTALSPIFLAKKEKIPLHIWVDETRPRNQGALLTSWELKNENIPHTVIVDNAGGYLMQDGKVDLCIVGSDRTTINGDVCNKIGTYLKALSAYENNVPFYVALPTSTIDENLEDGSLIPIEVRNGNELIELTFNKSQKLGKGCIFLKSTKTFNPAFDVTPAKFITKLITENGICDANINSIKEII